MGTIRPRFQITEFQNRSASTSWKVSGFRRCGERIRQNFSDFESARLRQLELESEYFAREPEQPGLRATRLSASQIQLAEVAFQRLGNDDDLLSAVELWLRTGKQARANSSTVTLEAAVEEFCAFVEKSPEYRPTSAKNLVNRVSAFARRMGRTRLDSITADDLDRFLDGKGTGAVDRGNAKRAISRFFGWCAERPRRWLTVNPCLSVKVPQLEQKPPGILTVEECARLLRAAEVTADGRAAPFIAVCLFAALRPTEAERLTWACVNLADSEIRLEAVHAKTKRPRVIELTENLKAWLARYEGQPFAVRRRLLDEVKFRAGFAGRIKIAANGQPLKPWTPDILRHSAISHRFRATGSFGLTAEWAGNSEAIIRRHYFGRVSSEDTRRFYQIMPTR